MIDTHFFSKCDKCLYDKNNVDMHLKLSLMEHLFTSAYISHLPYTLPSLWAKKLSYYQYILCKNKSQTSIALKFTRKKVHVQDYLGMTGHSIKYAWTYQISKTEEQ